MPFIYKIDINIYIMKLPEDILWKIWTFTGPKAYFLDKSLINIIKFKRNIFLHDPLRIHYKLCRWKKRHYYNYVHDATPRSGRATMYVESPKFIDLSGNCSIGNVGYDKTLKISQKLADKLIPMSTMHECTNGFKLTVLYWTIDSVWCIDERTKLYSRLWPSWKLKRLETF